MRYGARPPILEVFMIPPSETPEPSPPQADPSTPQPESTAGPETHASSAAAKAEPAHEAGEASDSGSADHEAGESEGHEGGAAPEAGAAGATAEGGAPHKKRRRRRRKGPRPEGDAAAAGATPEGEGAPKAEGQKHEGQKHEGQKRDRKKKDRPRDPHLRPAFGVGDVVFGKILEIGDDAIFIDVAGKAKAVFDKLELLLPEDVPDEVEIDAKRAEAEAEAIVLGKDPAAAGQAVIDAAKKAAEEKAAAPAEEAKAEEASAEAAPAGEATEAAPAAEAATEAPAEAQAPAAPVRRIVTFTPRAPEGEAATEAEASAPVDAHAAETQPELPEAGATGETPALTEEAKPGVIQLPRVVMEPGSTFVGVVHNDGGRGGLVVLTHHPKRASRAKPGIAAAFKEHTEIFGLVTGVIKGGVEVDIDGLRAFAPGSHMDLRLGADLHPLVGKRLSFHVTNYGKRGRDVVLSRRAMLEVEAKAARELALTKITVGATVEGTVKSVVPFGAFVDVGGVEGLVPLAEMSHNRSDGPHDVFKVGEKTTVKIQRVDEKGKIWLSRKATIADPWLEATQKYAVGTKHTGKVVRLQPFGAFVELESGIDGLIHASDLSLKRIEHPSEVVKIDDSIDVVVASLDPGTHKISLHPAPTGEAANEEPQRVQLHKQVKVIVVAIDPGGLLVRVTGATGRHARGFIPASATGTPRGTDLRKSFPPGKELDAKVIEIDPRRGEVKLSIRAMQQDTERNAYQAYRQQVKREAKFGTFADLLAKKGPTQK